MSLVMQSHRDILTEDTQRKLRVFFGHRPALVFENALKVWEPRDPCGALSALIAADDALNEGYYVAGALSYELGALLNGVPSDPGSKPILILGAFGEPTRHDISVDQSRFMIGAPIPRISRSVYDSSIGYLLGRIRDGAVYQVNYTVPFDCAVLGSLPDLYGFLAERALAPYSAYLVHETISLLSLSPELFLRFDGDQITAKPMKGTAPASCVEELAAEKNRAEHLMIVDLLRNDLHRVCEHVNVSSLFDVERYPTFATMTSTITATLSGASFADVIRATFPCGSVTGAPKRAALEHIAAVEKEPRGFYTGSIGYLSPRRQGWWNVAIRTLQFEAGNAIGRFDAGGGIVSDSTAESEWNEMLLKSRFLEPACGLTILETLRNRADEQTITAHLNRLKASAEAFGWRLEPQDELVACIRAFDSLLSPHLLRVRTKQSTTTIDAEPLDQVAEPVPVWFSSLQIRSDDPMLRHKTSWRPVHDAAAREAFARGCFDAILSNERGEITEGSRTNVFIRRHGVLLTPPLSSGVLPGILRSRLLAEGRATECSVLMDDIGISDEIYVGNSARGLLRAHVVGAKTPDVAEKIRAKAEASGVKCAIFRGVTDSTQK
jgi:para-aminobenzoate synthetase / 4-amino-4-deoxychorismate lyase